MGTLRSTAARAGVAMLVTAAGVATLAAMTGCSALSGTSQRRLDFTDTERATFTTIVIKPGAGDVAVRTGTVDETTIKRIVRYRGDEPADPGYRVDGSSLLLITDCGRLCTVSYEVTAPTGVAVSGSSGSGDIDLRGVSTVEVELGSGNVTVQDASGDVQVRTGSGNIAVSRAGGAVALYAGSGTVTGTELGGGAVRAQAGSGNVDLRLATANSVQARSGSGSVQIAVPPDHYRVHADSGSGSRDVTVTDEPAASLLIDARTGSGNLSVRQG
ncbi:DUF4097 family beta strand repeat-containing protein [Plantactinospora sp. KBS50]|uniref:DUF4097 family beta strand repeat-containing protein n=1 Tax=Plantactinospora sp. KBS50 TaxID=2024580 RepID=UPI000BAB1146|nr:DUF4097 family beta strand repeat-containing protein [Plantactinospora sp. KBS50]ASW56251.1 hypothetical protein CIK06_21955 [Plantactinospora sp. KBS50]